MMKSLPYTIKRRDLLFKHAFGAVSYVRDDDSSDAPLHNLESFIRSGDYFVTLATRLDELSEAIADSHEPESVILERIINDLLYLQAHYEIKRR